MAILQQLLYWLKHRAAEPVRADPRAVFFPDIADFKQDGSSWAYYFACRIVDNYEEARRRLYDGTFARILEQRCQHNLAEHATHVVQTEPDHDVGLFVFAASIGNSDGLLKVAKALVNAVPAICVSLPRLEKMIWHLPEDEGITLHDEETRSSWYSLRPHPAHEFLSSLLLKIEPTDISPQHLLYLLRKSPARGLQRFAANGLRARGCAECVPELLQVVIDSDADWKRKLLAVHALGEAFPVDIFRSEHVRSLFELISKHCRLPLPKESEFRSTIINCVRRLARENMCILRQCACEADIPLIAGLADMEAVSLLVDLMSDSRRSMRLAAAMGLLQIGGYEAAEALRLTLALEPDPTIRQIMECCELVALPSDRALAKLRCESSQNLEHALAMIRALAGFKKATACGKLVAIQDDVRLPNWAVQQRASSLLGAIQNDRGLPKAVKREARKHGYG